VKKGRVRKKKVKREGCHGAEKTKVSVLGEATSRQGEEAAVSKAGKEDGFIRV